MNLFEAVKDAVPTIAAAEHYGIEVKRNGMACCPFHAVSYTHLRAHETQDNLVCRLLLEKNFFNDTATTEIYTMAVVGSVRCV